MKKILFLLTLLVSSTHAFATSSNVQLIFQPIYRNGENPDGKVWNGQEYKILGVMYLNVTYRGKPAYAAISQRNNLLTNSRHKSEQELDSNLLSMLGIRITFDSFTSQAGHLYIDVVNAKELKSVNLTVSDGVHIALECIRRTAEFSECSIPPVTIQTSEEDKTNWKAVTDRFKKHIQKKPFKKR